MLVERAMVLLDDAGVERLEKLRRVAAKKMRRAGMDRPPVDMRKVKETLVLYAGGMAYREAAERTWVNASDMHVAADLVPEVKVVMEYARECRHTMLAMENEDIVGAAQGALKAGLTDLSGETKVNAKLVELALSGLDRERFGDERVQAATDARPQTVYQITGIQINALPAAEMRRVLPSSGVVDVEKVLLEANGHE